ncbi:stage 0 sporulation family protein [Eggerthella guodeyinii]|uniref:PSP1 C-terminal domain-containing protein n=1 Tax=Eggerthella guodeyinii TaxID=2690837 RepID=A0A6N7RQM4_9ACTN|nr:regulatory iron-sulfur-containing complex subunit RicT [Eggerthella guodeyinii]MRX83307.1 hypothetical protein [Eggerthella guodeyinii]
MVRIAPINLYYNPKTLWFDAGDLDVRAGDGVIVTTARGTEFGRAAHDVFEADEAQVKKLKSPLKPVKRIATDEDEARAADLEAKAREALPVFKEMASEASGDMHPVSVEYLFEGDKAIFYFEAEERVDFRELVRKLAAHFHVRIDMRQIGVRDEARMVGGLGHCGQELCCKRLGGEFCPVSIRMAKEQDLSLNPQKISGVCGRLMCCLRYEFDAYKDFKSRAPKQNATVETPDGPAKVVDLDVPREVVSLKIMGEKPVKVPLADFEPPEEGSNRPNRVGEEAWQDATTQDPIGFASESALFSTTTQLTGQDKLADPGSVRRTGRGGQKQSRNGGGSNGGRGGNGNQKNGGGKQQADAQGQSTRKPRRRRSTKVGGEGAAPETAEAQKRKQKQQGGGAPKGGQGGPQQKRRQGQGQGGNGGNGNGGGKKQQGQRQGGEGAKKQGPKGMQPSKQRPGQKSSGLRQGQKPQQSRQDKAPRPERSGAPGPEADRTGDGGHRRARRRSHKAGGPESAGAPGAGGAAPSGE